MLKINLVFLRPIKSAKSMSWLLLPKGYKGLTIIKTKF